jgi:ABC-type uncharacterized transport system permease subunit
MRVEYSEKIGAWVGLYESTFGLAIISVGDNREEVLMKGIDRLYKRNKNK